MLRLKKNFVNEILELRIDEFRKLCISLNKNLIIGHHPVTKENLCLSHFEPFRV